MPLLLWILLFTAIGGALRALAASLFLVAPESLRVRVLPHLVSFATGALLSAALLGLLPHAIEGAGVGSTHTIGLTLLAGLMIFFVLEKMVLWRHCHQEVCEGHTPPAHAHDQGGNGRDAASARLILIGDGFHNVLDGVLIASAFMTDVHLGVVTLNQIQHLLPYAIVIAAASFLYIAVEDLITGLHRRVDPGSGVKQFVFIVLGVALIYVIHRLAH